MSAPLVALLAIQVLTTEMKHQGGSATKIDYVLGALCYAALMLYVLLGAVS